MMILKGVGDPEKKSDVIWENKKIGGRRRRSEDFYISTREIQLWFGN